MKITYVFYHHCGFVDNLKGFFTCLYISKLKKHNIVYSISKLRKIGFEKYLNHEFLNNSKTNQIIKCIGSNPDRKNILLENIYNNTSKNDISIMTNVSLTDISHIFKELDGKFIENFIFENTKKYFILQPLIYVNRLKFINDGFIIFHYRIGDEFIGKNISNETQILQNITSRTIKLCDSINLKNNKIILMSDCSNAITELFKLLPVQISNNIIILDNLCESKHFHDIYTHDEFDFLISDIDIFLKSSAIYFCQYGSGSGFALHFSITNKIPYFKF